jgi:hypothetical protein
MPEGAYACFEARFEISSAQMVDMIRDREEQLNEIDEAFSFDRAVDDGFNTFIQEQIRREEDRNIVNAIAIAIGPIPPLFDVIGFKPSKENEFNYPQGESIFAIYGVKGISSSNSEK